MVSSILSLFAAGSLLILPVSARSAPTVNLGYASFSGSRNTTTGIDSYLGLFYAQAPVGDLRWKAPVPIENNKTLASQGVISATASGPRCIQGTATWAKNQNGNPLSKRSDAFDDHEEASPHRLVRRDPAGDSENCLLLDVLTPINRGSAALPVVVNIHGGGYISGSVQDGTTFTKTAGSSILWVSIQYRLGAYGFIGGSDYAASGGAPNPGLLDQRAALTWVQNHISAFGGDPKKVTIWGGSAGGGSVVEQVIMNGGQSPPFRAAIAEFPWMQPLHFPAFLQQQYNNLLSTANCNDLACLRGLSASSLSDITFKSYDTGFAKGLYTEGDFYYGPYVDGSVIREFPSAAFAGGRFAKVPLLIDRDDQEALFFSNFSVTKQDEVESHLKTLLPQGNSSFFDTLFSLYPQSAFVGSFYDQDWFRSQQFMVLANSFPNIKISANDSSYWQLMTLTSQFVVDCPTRNYAAGVASAGLSAYKLIFNAGNFLHAATGQYLFGNSPDNVTLSNFMRDYFLSFVVNLDPNAGPNRGSAQRPAWPKFGNTAQILQVNVTGLGGRTDRDTDQKCGFWRQQGSVVTN